ncbi:MULTISPECIES: nitroreductase family protein [unclassified Ornithinimicrobium]|uniref:nitroreductase family protein n=1 Tax=unclassified Ornithinimicrobium TaxID=2615080 RepID=UPI0038527D59
MELREVLARRRMVREFDPDRPVPEDVLSRVLDHARRGPSAGFSQGTDLLVLTRAEDRRRWWRATVPGWDEPGFVPDRWLRGVSTAPCLVVCLSDPQAYLGRYAEPDKGRTDRDPDGWPVPWWDVDTGMAALLMLLTAVDEGLGGLLFGVPAERQDDVRRTFAVPPERRLVGVVALGYAVPHPPSRSVRRGRRPVGEVVHDGRFGVPWSRPGGSSS